MESGAKIKYTNRVLELNKQIYYSWEDTVMEIKIAGKYIEIYFDSIPNDNIRNTLKICGWRWIKNKKCWSNFKSKDNLMWAEAMCKECNPKTENPLLTLEHRRITMKDLLVRSNGFYCNKKHNIKDYAGEVEVIDRKGMVHSYLIPIAYCVSCDEYYILEETFEELKGKGIIRCNILKYKQHIGLKKNINSFGEWKDFSPLRMMGYTVSENAGYKELQRQAILEDILDYGLLTKDEVLSYLDFFVKMHGDRNGGAVEKWKEDRKHIADYKLGSSKRISVGNIIVFD